VKRRALLHATPALLGLPSLGWTQAAYPNRPIRHIVPVAAGGGSDMIRKIIHGDVVSEIDVETPWGIVPSVITTRSIDQLERVVGSDVVVLVNFTEVSIAKL
jgi:molybdopterin-binding protein